ncbi:hypothetical protein ROZALSC1DRAFT_28346 [Rozella allomycis CSF55]|uniref:RNA ligase domain-containing protein n=1 Tax=Rozella allomycis (strain CSF55) TaxID=988480 RepID=A0A4P9YND2_ROZAC|nr:hypothetical protein ROZALSC1DRAFT_28346 [Rozella allomycis CSF55]
MAIIKYKSKSLLKFPSIKDINTVLPILKSRFPEKKLLTFRGTPKMNGVQMSILFDHGRDEYCIQSRTKSFNEEERDKWGFRKYIERDIHMRRIKKMVGEILDYRSGKNHCRIVGEWCGSGLTDIPDSNSMAVQKIPNMWYVFGVQIHNEWIDLKEIRPHFLRDSKIYSALDFPTFDLQIDLNDPSEALSRIKSLTLKAYQQCPLGIQMNARGRGEGFVWTCMDDLKDLSLSFKSRYDDYILISSDKEKDLDIFFSEFMTSQRIIKHVEKRNEELQSIRDLKSRSQVLAKSVFKLFSQKDWKRIEEELHLTMLDLKLPVERKILEYIQNPSEHNESNTGINTDQLKINLHL